MAEFAPAVTKVLEHEGGYSNHIADAGGETKYGISSRAHPDVDIAGLTRAKAEHIYRRHYWDANPRLRDLTSQALATKVFDLIVNMNAAHAIKILQNAVNQLSGAKDAVVPDGKLGPRTVQQANRLDPDDLLAAVRELAAAHYRGIVKRRPGQRGLLRGWLRRAYD